jgi:hypothetical protein
MIDIDSDGIEWSGFLGIIVLKAKDGTEAGDTIARVFQPQMLKKEKVDFAVTFPEQGGRRERREASGTVKSYLISDGTITVLISVDKPVAIKYEMSYSE